MRLLDHRAFARNQVAALIARAILGVRRRPLDVEIDPEPFQKAAGERVVAGSRWPGRCRRRDAARVRRGQRQVLGRGVERHLQLTDAGGQLANRDGAKGIRVLGSKPCFRVDEQPFAGWHSRDESALRGLPDEEDGGTLHCTSWYRLPTIPGAGAID